MSPYMDFTSTSNGLGAGSDPESGLININGSTDPCYRYKMHPIQVSYISESGGTTVIDNGEQVAQEIYRELSDLKTAMARGLGSRVSVRDGRILLPGNYTAVSLQKILAQYIQDNVLCERCGNPETLPGKRSRKKCNACGKTQSK